MKRSLDKRSRWGRSIFGKDAVPDAMNRRMVLPILLATVGLMSCGSNNAARNNGGSSSGTPTPSAATLGEWAWVNGSDTTGQAGPTAFKEQLHPEMFRVRVTLPLGEPTRQGISGFSEALVTIRPAQFCRSMTSGSLAAANGRGWVVRTLATNLEPTEPKVSRRRATSRVGGGMHSVGSTPPEAFGCLVGSGEPWERPSRLILVICGDTVPDSGHG